MGANELHVEGPVPDGMQIAVQVSHDWGWTATQDGTPITIRRNHLGFMTLEPRPAPAARILLQYRAVVGTRAMAALSALAWVGALAGLFVKRRR